MGRDVKKPVSGVSNRVIFKLACSATETSLKIEISLISSLDMILYNKPITKGLIRLCIMRRLVCAFVVHKPQKTGFLAARPK